MLKKVFCVKAQQYLVDVPVRMMHGAREYKKQRQGSCNMMATGGGNGGIAQLICSLPALLGL